MTLRLLMVAMVLVIADGVRGQCGEWDGRFGTAVGVSGRVYAQTTWDADGDGPLNAWLIVGGDFVRAGGGVANRIAAWDGQTWRAFGNGLSGNVHALTSWDPDGAGPQPARLVAGGAFAGGIAQWDGTSWTPFGTGMNSTVYALGVLDTDGNGPLGTELVAGGGFSTSGGVTTRGVARWDGTQWRAMGSLNHGIVRGLTAWDPDGAGPESEQLVIAGMFTAAGGGAGNYVARWNGINWSSIGSGLSTGSIAAYCVAACDFDGPGPAGSVLLVGGRFSVGGSTLGSQVARWDGTAWQPIGAAVGLGGQVNGLCVWDPDGSGPLHDRVLAVGSFTVSGGSQFNRIAAYDGSEWSGFVATISVDLLECVGTWDMDGVGGEQAWPVIGGGQTSSDSYRVMRWDGTDWNQLGSGLNQLALSVTAWDADGDPATASEVVAGGQFGIASGVRVKRIARWAGHRWEPLDEGANARVEAVESWDPDGPGGAAPLLIAGGEFTSIGGVSALRIASWDGEQWSPMGAGFNHRVRQLFVWDADGEGPGPASLYAGGNFSSSGSTLVNAIARWDGGEWLPLGTGMPSGVVLEMTTWDPDGSGPLGEQLVVAGAFDTAGGVASPKIARWDGSDWYGVGPGVGGLSPAVYGAASWDHDGDGSTPARLVVGGNFSPSDGMPTYYFAQWDGISWSGGSFGLVSSTVNEIMSVDVDGGGTMPEQLIVGGAFNTAGGVASRLIALWDGTAWRSYASGMEGEFGEVCDLMMWDSDGPGPSQNQLIAVGGFTAAGGVAAGNIALWSTQAPQIVQQPVSVEVSVGEGVMIEAEAVNGTLAYQWKRGASNVIDGPTGFGSVVTGAQSSVLTITNAQAEDAGAYSVVVTNSCGSVTSDEAMVVVTPPSCPGDANGDGSVDGADLSVMLGQFNQSVTPGTGADFNGDGVVNGADLSVLLGQFGQTC